MKVRDIMTTPVVSVGRNESISRSASIMADEDVGVLPIVENGGVAGIVTDRDIAVRAIASRTSPDAAISRIMTEEVVTCSPDDDLQDALELMANEQVRRLPVCDAGGKLIGIVTLADAALRDPDKAEVGEVLNEICEPAGVHSQAPVFA